MQKSMNLKTQLIERLGKLASDREISDLAERSGVEQSSISRTKAGKQNLGLDKVSLLLEALGAQIAFPDDAEEPKATMRRMGAFSPSDVVEGPDLVAIPVFEKVGAGDEVDFFAPNPEHVIKVLPRYALENVIAIEVVGDSMEPIIRKGAFIGVVPLDDRLIEGQIYLVRRPHFGLVVKRVIMGADGRIVLRSENAAYPDQPVPDEGYESIIVGKVVWVWQLV